MDRVEKPTADKVHPGIILKKVLDTRLMDIDDLAKYSRYDSDHYMRIIDGEEDIDRKTSIELERLLSIESKYWLTKQKLYNKVH